MAAMALRWRACAVWAPGLLLARPKRRLSMGPWRGRGTPDRPGASDRTSRPSGRAGQTLMSEGLGARESQTPVRVELSSEEKCDAEASRAGVSLKTAGEGDSFASRARARRHNPALPPGSGRRVTGP